MTVYQRVDVKPVNIFAVTASASYLNQALEEAREADKELKILQNYGNGILLAEPSIDREAFNKALVNKNPIFIRHISAFDKAAELDENTSPADLAKLVERYKGKIPEKSKVSVQIRKTRGEYSFDPFDLKCEIDKMLPELGVEPEIKQPDFIISVLLDGPSCYIGMGPGALNLSIWSGGMIHFKKEDTDISRAKFKLLEALILFDLDLSSIHSALDLGAAPGGWTSVLLEKGLAVTSVDTGEMDKRLSKFKKFTYIKANASELELMEQSFDLLTSDISWNAKNTAAMVNRAARFLKDEGYAIVTVKLMSDKVRRTIREVREIYQEVFDVIAVKQLFHNRDEVTILLRKRGQL